MKLKLHLRAAQSNATVAANATLSIHRNPARETMNKKTALVWFRNDLRTADNPALRAAVDQGFAVAPVFIWAPDEEGDWAPGGASRWWLHQSLKSLETTLREKGGRLILRNGDSLERLRSLARATGAGAVFWNRRYEPAIIERDKRIKQSLRDDGLRAESFNGALLREPWEIQNKAGKPFQVFTPFWKTCREQISDVQPVADPRTLDAPAKWPSSLSLEELELEPKINWAEGLRSAWQPGEAGAEHNLKRFLNEAFPDYGARRNRPDLAGTSRLSPHLHFGELSPRQIWRALELQADRAGGSTRQWRDSQFLAEVGWREFAHHLLFHFPHTPTAPLRAEFEDFPWRENEEWLRAWQRGQTGYPLVDAGMRELWATGWMHNRVRMVIASFLVKNCLIPWQAGARWFWDTLVDADLASNTLGWQWTAGCGADAAPYFRVFNPITQGEKFDPEADYIRQWVPQLRQLPTRFAHQPWEAGEDELRRAGVKLGGNYPQRLMSHKIAREVALEACQKIKKS